MGKSRGFCKMKGTEDNSIARLHNGKVRLVISKALSSSQGKDHTTYSSRPIRSKLPYPERMKVRENDKPSAQHSRFLKMFKQLRLEIGLKDALIEMPKFNKCSETLEDPGKILIPCALQELDRTSALADSRASINLLPHSIYKQLGLEALTPTRMTLELANRSITHPMGIAEDVVVRVDGFTFLADFVVVNFEPDPKAFIFRKTLALHCKSSH
ncbi:reverse transcriptase domain-containing protein [Tanacetum coccineum]